MTLLISLLGPLRVASVRCPVLGLTSRKARALLAYLAFEAGRPHPRQALAGLLWPEHPERMALGSLRHALSDLRRAIGDDLATPPFLLVTRETIQLNPEADCWLDVTAFERKLSAISDRRSAVSDQPSAAGQEAQAIENLHAAIALYRGPFLEGFSLGDSPVFEEWLLLKREQLNRRLLRALNSLAALYEGCREYEEALACVRRIIELEPWQEEAHRQAMRLLALAGRRSEALVQFLRCRHLMIRELGVEPGPETAALHESICAGTLAPTMP